MRARHIVLGVAAATLLGAAAGAATESRLRIEVTPRVSPAPAAVRVRAFVAPDEANRGLRIVVDSGEYYRSSLIPLDGANAASITETTLKNLPGGDYDVAVVLVDMNGRRTIDRRKIVVTAGTPY